MAVQPVLTNQMIFEIIHSRIDDLGISFREFEDSLGYYRGYLSRVVSGKRKPPELTKKLVKALNLPDNVYPFGLTYQDYLEIRERRIERPTSVVGEAYRDELEPFSIDWATMFPQAMEELVWEYPSTVLAVMCGVSDVAISKYCRKHNIKKPPRGYWAKQGRYTPNYSGKSKE